MDDPQIVKVPKASRDFKRMKDMAGCSSSEVVHKVPQGKMPTLGP